MKRRQFLKIAQGVGVSSFFVNGFAMRPFANRQMANTLASCDSVRDRVLVLIQMKGGNDGINTVIPLAHYDRYAELRPTTRLLESAIINIDSTLPTADQTGLHPAMTGIKALYDKGWASVIQGVGYQSMNQSHFKGTDLWLSGGGGSPALNNIGTGWMGRSLQAFFPEVEGVPTPEAPDPLGIQLGDPYTSLGFHTETEHQNVINLSGQDPAGFYSLIQTIGGAPLAITPDSDHGDELDYIMGVEQSINLYASRITQVFNAGSNAITAYPNNSFAAQLKTIARLIRGGCKTKIYLCQIGGFDTHSAQVDSGDTSLGAHTNLLKNFSDSVKTFFDDLEGLGIADQVMACTFSEFGRCAKENGSFGTDHGTLSPMMVFGKGVRPKVHGTNVNLFDLSNDNQLRNMQFDYRQVFGSLLQDWLGANDFVMQESMFDVYAKMRLIDKDLEVNPACYFGGSIDVRREAPRRLRLSPNPASVHVEVTYESEGEFNALLSLHSLGGTLISMNRQAIATGTNVFFFDVSTLGSGTYFVRIENQTSGRAEVAKLMVTR
ncbi:MAG: DUF1501 domain-containing protein [Chitinophagales bacterium]|nr:DUF1501 domain-containing protein [Chitinophagales bacterium]